MFFILFACSNEPKTKNNSKVEDTAHPLSCSETGNGELPENIEWIVLDGNSDDIFHLGTENALTNAYAGSYGTYDLNTVAFEGGNGFLLERPGRVVGAEVQ